MQEENIGALWIKKGKKGDFFSGQLTVDGVVTSIIVFKNDYKKSDKHPDYQIYLSKKHDDGNAPKVHLKEVLEPF